MVVRVEAVIAIPTSEVPITDAFFFSFPSSMLRKMLSITTQMVKDASDALIAWDADKAKTVLITDNAIDEIHKNAYKDLHQRLTLMYAFLHYAEYHQRSIKYLLLTPWLH